VVFQHEIVRLDDLVGEPAVLDFLTPDPEVGVGRGFEAHCPALPGVHTQGETLEEARAMARDAIQGYLESLTKDGQPIPNDVKLQADPVLNLLS
jgi:predicted RNase H-like HicB family nuclease